MSDRLSRMPSVVGMFVFLVLVLVFVPAPVVAADVSWDFRPVSDPALDAIYADISGDYIIYSGSIGDAINQNSTRVIQLHSISNGEEIRIANSTAGSTLTGEDIDGDYAVWFSEPQLEAPAGIPNRIFLYSIPAKTVSGIRTSQSAEWPRISGKSVIWSESANDSFASSVMHYEIGTGAITRFEGISSINAAGIRFNGDYILYSDAETMDLILYSTATGNKTVVFANKADNDTRENVFGTALGADYVLYRKDVFVEKPKELYSELCLYSISTGETRLISPVTGVVTETLSESDKKASFNSLAADGSVMAWDVAEGIADDRIVVLDTDTMAVSSISPETFVDFINIDSDRMVWLAAKELAGNGSIYLAISQEGQGQAAAASSTSAPGFGLIIALISIPAGIFLARRR